MKTGVYPMKVKLKLFFKWGIEFEEPYVVPEQADRQVDYAYKDEIIKAILLKYNTDILADDREDVPYSEVGGMPHEQKEEHFHTEQEQITDDLELPEDRPKSAVVTDLNKPKTVESIEQMRQEEERYAKRMKEYEGA